MCFVSQLNFLSGVAAAVRRGCSIVEANKGPQRSLAFSQELWPEGGGGPEEDADTLVCLVRLHARAFPMKSHHWRPIMKEDRLD